MKVIRINGSPIQESQNLKYQMGLVVIIWQYTEYLYLLAQWIIVGNHSIKQPSQ